MKTLLILASLFALLTVGTVVAKNMNSPAQPENTAAMNNRMTSKAMFAGGCFWCMEKPFEQLTGVVSVVSGYAGGSTENPTYKNYGRGGHIEVVEITFNPQQITFEELLEVFWQQIDPTDGGGQFVDRGHAYSSAIFYHNEEQRLLAETSKENLSTSGIFNKPIVTPIIPIATFYAAEEYHQDYYKKNSIRYKFYRSGSGRDTFLKSVWGKENKVKKMSSNDLKAKLTPLQYKVTQEEGTEPPFKNSYWDNKKPGIYVDIVSNEPLFSSLDKYDSGTGWPSFSRPLIAANIVEKEDKQFFSVRTEVRSTHGDSHLGHLFDDGPLPTGLRYCINSASLRFVPVDKLEEEGHGDLLKLFK